MATKDFYHDLNGLSINSLKNWRLNPMSTTARTALSLSSSASGLPVYDTDLNQLFFWSGSAWVSGTASITGAMNYKGAYSNLATAPTTPSVGDTYVMTVGGTLAWAGVTFNPSAVVQVGDMLVYRGTSVWDVIQGNAVASAQGVAGIIAIADQTTTNTGTDDTVAVTPLKLTSFTTTKAFAKVYFASGVGLTANTGFTVSHNLNLQNKDSYVIAVKDASGNIVDTDVVSVNINSLTVTSSITVTNFTITVIGF